MEFVDVAETGDIPVGRARAVEVDGQPVTIIHTSAGFFATDGRCPHRGGPLAEGDVIGDEIVCPWHLWGFDVRTGICEGNREISVAVHEVRVVDGRVQVRLVEAPQTMTGAT